MDHEFQQFAAKMAEGADATTHDLELEEEKLRASIGPERSEELKLLWTKQLAPEDEADVKRLMDWNDKKLIWLWHQIAASRERRALAGRAAMINSQMPNKG